MHRELCEIGHEEAADLVELLRVCSENRRSVKNELTRIDYFQGYFGTDENAAKARQALKGRNGLASRKYKPGKYVELFENCTMRDRRGKSADTAGTAADQRYRNLFQIKEKNSV